MAAHTYDRGGAPDGTLSVSIERFYGDELVSIEFVEGDSGAHLTSAQAREVAADLIAHADSLDASH